MQTRYWIYSLSPRLDSAFISVKVMVVLLDTEDCTTPYTILGIECDLPHPLIFGGIYGDRVHNFTEAIRPEVQEIS